MTETYSPTPVALALGTNMGGRPSNIRAAVAAVAAFIDVTAVSPVYDTPAAYVTDQPAFLNAALIGTTVLPAMELLQILKETEHNLGRIETFHYGPRVIDLDILFYGDWVMSTPELILPHPLMHERMFVLRPLADIAPDWKHPVTGVTVRGMLENLATPDL